MYVCIYIYIYINLPYKYAIGTLPYTLFIYIVHTKTMYRKISNIRHTKSQNLNDSRLVLLLSLPNPLKPSVKSRMKM